MIERLGLIGAGHLAGVVVEGNRIVAVGPAASVSVPSGAHVVDASGRTLMPGLIDGHAHFGGAGGGLTAETDWPYYANLAFGVTTGHDPSNSNEMIFTDMEMIRAGHKVGPRKDHGTGLSFGCTRNRVSSELRDEPV